MWGRGGGSFGCRAALEALLAVRECQLETRTISIMERIEEVIECKGHGHGHGWAGTRTSTKQAQCGWVRQQQQQ